MQRLKLKKPKSWKPSVSTVLALLIVAGGVTFALLQSQVDLTSNSVQTDSAGLLISSDDLHYTSSANGFDFVHIIPGSKPSQTQRFTLQNTGSAPLALRLKTANSPANPNNIDLNKVKIIITSYDTQTSRPGTPQSFTLGSLIDGGDGVPLSYPTALQQNTKENFDIQVAMDADAVSGSGAMLSNLDLIFAGVAVSG